MLKTKALMLLAALCLVNTLPAQTTAQLATANHLFSDTKEIYFEFTLDSKTEIKDLTKFISIDNVRGLNVTAFASKKGFLKFLQYKPYTYNLLQRPNQQGNITMLKDGETPSLRALIGTYPTYPQYVTMMQNFAANYPSLCKFYDLGTLPSGRKILALKITDNPNAHENEPEFFYTSSMHGDETAGYPTMLNLADYLLSNYGTDARVTNLVNNIEIWINPLANPDGTYADGDLTLSGATRYNANGVDLNRNYPDPEDGAHPDGESYQPETQIFMGFADTMHFVMAANFHGGAEVANYPWDTWATNHADQNWWIQEAVKFADTCQANGPAGYMNDLYAGSNPGVTNGYDWYEVNGGRQDYMQWFHQCKELTVELSTTKLIPNSQILNHWNYTHRSLLNYMEACTYGIRGIITDQCTGQPIRAKVFISGHDFDSSFVYSSLPVGNYHRPIYAGTYNVTYSAPGYQPVTIPGITVINNAATVYNLSLQPLAPVANFTATDPSGCTGIVNFTDLTGSASGWNWNFGDGGTSTDQNPTHQYTTSGTYTVTLSASNCAGSDTETKTSYVTVTVASAPLTVNDTATACSPQTLVLGASGTGTLTWYDAPTGGTQVATGTSYTTPLLSVTTPYYVESQNTTSPQFVGPADNTIGPGGYFTGAATHYEVFDALQPFTLVSVKVYAGAAGNRTIQLRNSAGTVLQSVTLNLPAGMSTATLNFNVPVGTDLQLGISGMGGNLYRNSSGAAYPYTIPGVVSINHSSAGPPSDITYYYFFYNWQIISSCNSARTPVYAVFDGTLPAPAITTGTTPTELVSSAPAGNQWYLDGVAIPGATGTTYTATANGNYYVIVTDGGCTSDPSNTLNINTVGLSNFDNSPLFSIYPNPAQEQFTVYTTASGNYQLSLSDNLGKVVLVKTCTSTTELLNVGHLPAGLYFVQVKTAQGAKTQKLVIR